MKIGGFLLLEWLIIDIIASKSKKNQNLNKKIAFYC